MEIARNDTIEETGAVTEGRAERPTASAMKIEKEAMALHPDMRTVSHR